MRRSKEELRELMIDAGCELLVARGLAFDPPNLTYANVFQHLEDTHGIRLHRSQVHGRIWESQDHFRTEVAIEVIQYVAPGSDAVDDLVRKLPSSDQATVRQKAHAWIAASTEASRDIADADLRFDLLVAAQALSAKDSATDPVIAATCRSNLLKRTAHNKQRYEAVAHNLGVAPADVFDIDDEDAWSLLARTSSALLEGARLLESVSPDLTAPFVVNDDADNTRERDTATLGLCLVVEQLFGIGDAPARPDATPQPD